MNKYKVGQTFIDFDYYPGQKIEITSMTSFEDSKGKFWTYHFISESGHTAVVLESYFNKCKKIGEPK